MYIYIGKGKSLGLSSVVSNSEMLVDLVTYVAWFDVTAFKPDRDLAQLDLQM
jgi:hypothetical protein